MKFLIILIIVAILVYVFVFKDKDDDAEKTEAPKKNESHGRDPGGWAGLATGVDQVADYGTGATQVRALQHSKDKISQTSIENAVRNYQANTGRQPTSLNDLVRAGFLKKEQTRDKYGREYLSRVRNGRLLVQSVGRDGRANTADDWKKLF